MQIWISITTDDTDNFDMTPEEVADATFQALGADEDKDFCTVQMATPPPPLTHKGAPPVPPGGVGHGPPS